MFTRAGIYTAFKKCGTPAKRVIDPRDLCDKTCGRCATGRSYGGVYFLISSLRTFNLLLEY